MVILRVYKAILLRCLQKMVPVSPLVPDQRTPDQRFLNMIILIRVCGRPAHLSRIEENRNVLWEVVSVSLSVYFL